MRKFFCVFLYYDNRKSCFSSKIYHKKGQYIAIFINCNRRLRYVSA